MTVCRICRMRYKLNSTVFFGLLVGILVYFMVPTVVSQETARTIDGTVGWYMTMYCGVIMYMYGHLAASLVRQLTSTLKINFLTLTSEQKRAIQQKQSKAAKKH